MAKSVMRPEGEEVSFFHSNYIYMWKKLNTAPYYVSGFGECPSWIRGQELLPSYVNLSKCMNPDFVPSLNIVNKIVAFYNANITPSVDTYSFLHEHLEDSDRGRTALACASPDPYCGMYYCYHYAEAEDEKYIRGALLFIFEYDGGIRARLFADITDESSLLGEELKKLLCAQELTPEQFSAYKASLPLNRQTISYYNGAGKVDPGMITLRFLRADRDGAYLTLFMPVHPLENGQFIGSLGIMVKISSDRSFRFFRSGFERAGHPELKPLSPTDPKLKELLALKKGINEHISLSPADSNMWTDYLIFGSHGE